MEFAFIGIVWLLLIVLALITALSWAVRMARRVRRWWYETTPQTRYFVG
jgi:hypothetical protein